MNNKLLECIVKEPATPADACVIWLHGLGADGHDFENILPLLELPDSHRIRFVFPHASVRPITINNNMQMRGWYDIYSLNKLEKMDMKGIEDSCSQVNQLVQDQIQQGVLANRIVLAGFSQGGVIAMQLGLTCAQPLAGIIGLSTYLPCIRNKESVLQVQLAHKAMPILLCHGNQDDIIPFHIGKESSDYLNTQGCSPEWHAYTMGHEVCMEELLLIGNWLKRLLT